MIRLKHISFRTLFAKHELHVSLVLHTCYARVTQYLLQFFIFKYVLRVLHVLRFYNKKYILLLKRNTCNTRNTLEILFSYGHHATFFM